MTIMAGNMEAGRQAGRYAAGTDIPSEGWRYREQDGAFSNKNTSCSFLNTPPTGKQIFRYMSL